MNGLSERLKLNIFQRIIEEDNYLGPYGEYEGIVDFLNLIWPLRDMPSEDDRFKNAEEDAIQHLLSNDDWNVEDTYTKRFNILDDDAYFIKFVDVVVSPGVRRTRSEILSYVTIINRELIGSSFKVILTGYLNDLPVYNILPKNALKDRPEDIVANEIPFYHNGTKTPKTYPSLYLSAGNWDDFHNRTSFFLSYYYEEGKEERLGPVKIMRIDTPRTAEVLPEIFLSLDENYCSLGQEIEYYDNIQNKFPVTYLAILLALRDSALFPRIHEKFEEENSFKKSLIRFNEPEQLLRTVKFHLNGMQADNWYRFNYRCKLPYAIEPIELPFPFDIGGAVDHRVFALIGKNGTGKTTILSNLAKELSKTLPDNLFPRRPLYGKVFTVSYSIFDNFDVPDSDASFNYVYCGLKKISGGFLDRDEIIERILENALTLDYKSLKKEWYGLLRNFIPSDLLLEVFTGRANNLTFQPHLFPDFYSKLSSGQNILVLILTEILAQIRFNSLIIYDEPEMYLHPNAISQLMSTIFNLVNRFDSYCIIATHSPIVIQEIHARNVIIIERDEDNAYIRNLERESFGENLTVITEDIFGNRDLEKHYLSVVQSLVDQKKDYLQIMDALTSQNLPMNLNIRLYIKGLINQRDEEP
jgi:hypothetical protein